MPISVSDLAKALGISKVMAYRLKKRGMPVDCVEAARAWRAANLDPAQVFAQAQLAREKANASAEPSDATRFQQTRLAREQANAHLAALRLKLKSGELLPAAEVERTWTEMVVAFRTAMLRVPDSLPHDMLSDEVREEVRQCIELVLLDLSKNPPS